MDNSRLKFLVQNDINVGIFCNSQLKEELKNWIREHSYFTMKRIGQIWSATWEAIQNSIIHGSKPGDTIQIIVSYLEPNKLISVSVRQSQIWEQWENNLANNKQRLQTNEILMGGTIIMSQLADYINVFDSGRTIEMQFSAKIMPQRTLTVTRLLC